MKMGNNLTPEEIQAILIDLGYELQDRGAYWHTSALFRGGDNRTALQIYKNSGVWRDFVTNTPMLPFYTLLETHLGTNDPGVIGAYFKDSPERRAYKAPEPKLSAEEIHDESCLEKLFPHYVFYNERGIDTSILKFLKGGLAQQGQMYQRFVFPIYNDHFQIHGFSGRYMGENKNAPKWKHLGKKGRWIYPYYMQEADGSFPVQEAIEERNSVILVESIGDMLNLMQHGFKNVLVTFGLDVSPQLICHLMALNVGRIIIGFNNDASPQSDSQNAGLLGALKSYLKLLNYFDVDKLYICLPTKNDFGDMSSEDFVEWKAKCAATDLEAQGKNVVTFVNKHLKEGKISQNLYKNVRALESFLSE